MRQVEEDALEHLRAKAYLPRDARLSLNAAAMSIPQREMAQITAAHLHPEMNLYDHGQPAPPFVSPFHYWRVPGSRGIILHTFYSPMASVLIFPEPGDIEEMGVGSYISGQVRTIAAFLFVANLMLIGAELPHERAVFETDPAHIWLFYVPYNAAILACYGVMMATRSRSIAICAMVTLIFVYAYVTITRVI